MWGYVEGIWGCCFCVVEGRDFGGGWYGEWVVFDWEVSFILVIFVLFCFGWMLMEMGCIDLSRDGNVYGLKKKLGERY